MKSVIRLGLCVAALWGGAALAGEEWKDPAYGGAGDEEKPVYRADEERGADKGLYVLLGGGTEGYTGELAPNLNPGFAYGATVGFKPTRGLGLELAYSGGLSDIDTFGPGGAAEGADIIRNGGQAAVTVGITPTKLQPYLLGGIGIENHNVRGMAPLAGFEDDTSGYVPAGVGLRYNIGSLLTADARVSYNIPFAQDFAPVDDNVGNGRYQALLQLGGTY
jgi:opacity protein-like surface antigen